jgi:hypothetical protein
LKLVGHRIPALFEESNPPGQSMGLSELAENRRASPAGRARKTLVRRQRFEVIGNVERQISRVPHNILFSAQSRTSRAAACQIVVSHMALQVQPMGGPSPQSTAD